MSGPPKRRTRDVGLGIRTDHRQAKAPTRSRTPIPTSVGWLRASERRPGNCVKAELSTIPLAGVSEPCRKVSWRPVSGWMRHSARSTGAAATGATAVTRVGSVEREARM